MRYYLTAANGCLAFWAQIAGGQKALKFSGIQGSLMMRSASLDVNAPLDLRHRMHQGAFKGYQYSRTSQ